MATDVRALEARLAKVESQMVQQRRATRAKKVRHGAPSGGGTTVLWARLDEPTWRGQPEVPAKIYSDPARTKLVNGTATVLATAGVGYYLPGTGETSGVSHAVIRGGGSYELIGSGIHHISGTLQEDLNAGDSAMMTVGQQAGLPAITEAEVHAPWAAADDEPIAESGSLVGASWNDVEARWEATFGRCQDDIIVEDEP